MCLAAVSSTGCADTGTTVPETFVEQVQAHRDSSPVILPERRPPDLVDAWVSRSNGGRTSSTSFYSRNTPVVTVCTGDVDLCRSTNPAAPEVRADRVDGRDVVVLLGRTDDPAAPDVPLPADLDDFWAEVELTAGEPGWLGD